MGKFTSFRTHNTMKTITFTGAMMLMISYFNPTSAVFNTRPVGDGFKVGTLVRRKGDTGDNQLYVVTKVYDEDKPGQDYESICKDKSVSWYNPHQYKIKMVFIDGSDYRGTAWYNKNEFNHSRLGTYSPLYSEEAKPVIEVIPRIDEKQLERVHIEMHRINEYDLFGKPVEGEKLYWTVATAPCLKSLGRKGLKRLEQDTVQPNKQGNADLMPRQRRKPTHRVRSYSDPLSVRKSSPEVRPRDQSAPIPVPVKKRGRWGRWKRNLGKAKNFLLRRKSNVSKPDAADNRRSSNNYMNSGMSRSPSHAMRKSMSSRSSHDRRRDNRNRRPTSSRF